jgi:hypothetical protein
MDYTAIRKNAAATITKNGKTAMLNIPASTYNPITGLPASAVTSYTVKAVEILAKNKERPQTAVQNNERWFLLAALTTSNVALPVPRVDYTITVAGHEYFITAVMALEPGDVALVYEVHCRG